jgi:protein arginine kinase
VSSRVRLARNLKDAAFPGWAGEEECERILAKLQPVLEGLTSIPQPVTLRMADLDPMDKEVLYERHLMSHELVERGRGSAVVLTPDEHASMMVNEEDHLRLQSIRPGLDLSQAWKVIDAVDTEIEKSVRYAYSAQLGYLTACPTNVGTGMRASVMVHVPGLVLMNQINGVIKACSRISLAVRGLWGEGTEATGNMFQISNQISLGESEEKTVEHIEKIVLQIVETEKDARAQLMEKKDKETLLRDYVGRAYGILSNAHVLTSKEALDLLSGLRLGVDLSILKFKKRRVIDDLLLMTQPAHLQKLAGRKLNPKDRDRNRAALVRDKLAEAKKG